MTDEEYIYRQDIKERNSQKSGARNRVNGCKSKKCTLPSDHLTRAQRNQLNGPLVSYDPNKWYTWNELKELPLNFQQDWLNAKIEKYEVGVPTLCKYWFHVSAGVVYKHINSQGLDIIKLNGKCTRDNATRLWKDCEAANQSQTDVDSQQDQEDLEDKQVETFNETVEERSIESSKPVSFSSMSITMDGFDSAVLQTLKKLFEGKEVVVSISVEEKH